MTEECVEPAREDEAKGSGERLLEESASDDGSVAMFVGESGEGVAEGVELGKNYVGCRAKLADQAGVDDVLARGAPMNEACGFGVVFGHELSELFDEGDGHVGGGGDGHGEGVEVEMFGAAVCGDYAGRRGGNKARFGFRAGEGGFEIEHGLDVGRVGKERLNGAGIEEVIEKRHGKSVNVPGRRKNDFVGREGVR